jgi:hypothetical protein
VTGFAAISRMKICKLERGKGVNGASVLVTCSSEYVTTELINSVVSVMTNKSALVCDGESG